MAFTSPALLKKMYPKRRSDVHKGQFGKLLVLAGSNLYTGSPCFISSAAYKAGCDLVYLSAPYRASVIAAHFSPMIMTHPLQGPHFVPSQVSSVLKQAKKVRATALVIGPGLGREKKTRKAILSFMKQIDLPMVVDADAIRALAGNESVLRGKTAIITPHSDEFRELTGKSLSSSHEGRVKSVKIAARKFNATILLKGHVDIIASPRGVVLNKTGSPFMTKGGMGDTLAGIAGALLARGVEPFTAASAAAYVNGRAGERAAKRLKEAVSPLDLVEEIPFVR